jgi:enamine deaminase RidA (YjgF/YER057c/UK114 family)
MHRSISKSSPEQAELRRQQTTQWDLKRQAPNDEPTVIRREGASGLELTTVKTGGVTELHATVKPFGHEPPGFTVRRLAEVLNEADATVVRLIAFGALNAAETTGAALHQSLDDPGLPITWVEGAACDGRPLAGIQVHAIAGTDVTTLGTGAKAAGRLWKNANATHCVFGGLETRTLSMPREEQARAALNLLESELANAGMTFKDVVRTWFFLDNILDWYGEFNQVRNDFFAPRELRSGNVPASTGVSGRNRSGGAAVLAAWAVRPHDTATQVVKNVASPNQCPAPAYGSAFSRAVELQSPGFRQLLISGTASIGQDGKTVHAGDIGGQIECTAGAVQAILESRGMSLDHATRATAYFRNAADALLFTEWLERCGIRNLPVVSACCDICRDDLLFELELDAIAKA